MNKLFIASQLPEAAIAYLNANKIEFEYWQKNETISEEQLLKYLKNCSILVCGIDVQVTKRVIDAADQLKVIANVGDGYSNIDTSAAKERNIIITNAPTTASIASTAEQTVTLLLTLSRKILAGDQQMRNEKFKGWRVTGYVGGHQVFGKKLLVIGLGKVGQKVVEMLAGFDMDMYYTDLEEKEKEFTNKYNLKRIPLEEGLKIADYVTLNCSLTNKNTHMIAKKEFSMMKQSGFLINCGRGSLLKEADLVNALEKQMIAGAALDVYEFEPHVSEKLTKFPNVVLTPHAGNATVEARNEMALDAVQNVVRFFNNERLHYLVPL